MQYVGLSQNHRNSKMAACKSQMQDLILIQHTHTHTHTHIRTYTHTYVHTHIHTYTHNKNDTVIYKSKTPNNISNITFTHSATYIYMLVTQMNYTSK
jgi:hypothetical protein